ncbi:PREDICTED: NADH dehydrogenase [ubiquinone] iron-sulfur protein 5 [Charadrius vociferus]|uniref:NADH dehydrogenase [ubiquinone] iron-sulfur protein 5 n=1 Tax=Charadrius vociferus TaxID=50402 RepID=UPI0005217176|nr:PREDICTED: NADH dehydrogenase [ubiquinone] iron-sulfur protein 5 [Charadrius vociferus]
MCVEVPHRYSATVGGDGDREAINLKKGDAAMRLRTILEQRDKMIKEGKYTPPDYHKGKEEPRP